MMSIENQEFADAGALALLERARKLEATGRRLLSDISRSLRDSERCLQRRGPLPASLGHSIEVRLRSSPFLPLRQVTCEENDGRVILRGRVPTQYLQALAATVARSFGEMHEITNEIEVVPLGKPCAPILPPPARGSAPTGAI